jgi:hypothetical protein
VKSLDKKVDFLGYFALTKFQNRIIMRFHCDFERDKLGMKDFAINFAKSFSNFVTYVGLEFLKENLIIRNN